jgi:hypothetical protein
VCFDCAGFPTVCTDSLSSEPQAHTKHYVLLIHVSDSWDCLDHVLDVHRLEHSRESEESEYSESSGYIPNVGSKRLWEPWELLFESSNRWFEARAEDGGVAMAESPTTENPYGHPFIPTAPKIELPSLNALTSNGEDEKDLPRYCLAKERISVHQQRGSGVMFRSPEILFGYSLRSESACISKGVLVLCLDEAAMIGTVLYTGWSNTCTFKRYVSAA